MSKTFTDVMLFMKAVDQTCNIDNESQASLYRNLIIEEFWEFKNAIDKKDDVEQIDACFDMIWVIIGFMHSRGWNCEEIWDEGAKSNLAKIDQKTGKVLKREDGKVMKPEGWQKPNFSKFIK